HPRSHYSMRLFACLLALCATATAFGADEPPRSRTFLFTYATTISDLPTDTTARVWLPVAPSNDEQRSRIEKMPARAKVNYDPVTANHFLFVEKNAGTEGRLWVEVVSRVTRYERKGRRETFTANADRIKRFLEPDAKVPITGKPLKLLEGKTLPDDPMGK